MRFGFLRYHIYIYMWGMQMQMTIPPPGTPEVEKIEIPRMAVRPIRHPRGCIGASNGASTALKLPGKPEIHVFFVRLYTYAGP